MKIKKPHQAALTFIALSLSLSAWAEPLIVKIGSGEPKSGGIAHLGKDNEMGARLAINKINAKGDLTIGGKKVVLELVGEDDEGDPKNGPDVAQKLIDAGVVAVVGHLNSGVSIPANWVYSKFGLVQVSPTSTNPDYTLKSNRTPKGNISAYRVIAHDGLQGGALAQYAAQQNIKSVAILDDLTQYGQGMADQFERGITAKGIRVTNREAATDRTTDFKNILMFIKPKKPQLIFWGGMDDTGATLAKQMRQLGIHAKLITGDGACTDKFIELSGKAGNGTVCSQTGLSLNEMTQGDAFNQNFEREFPGHRVQIYAPFAYDAVYTIVEAMKIARSTDREAIAAAMPKVDFEGVTGRIRFDEHGDIINGAVTIFTVNNQRLHVEKVIR